MTGSTTSRLLAAAGALAAALPLAGCYSTDRVVETSVPMTDYRTRHPIVIADGRTSLDVFPLLSAPGLDSHAAKQVYAFAAEYREGGHGPVEVMLPRSLPPAAARAVVADIRKVLALGGARSGLAVATYGVGDRRLASPVRLSFSGLKAAVADQCGQWPNDLSSASSLEGWENKPYWNLGCATQTMIAAQTADPRDLVSPRGEDAADTAMRDRAVKAVRAGNDPNTNWIVKNSNIGNVGGGS